MATASQTKKSAFRYDIEALRTISIAFVLVYHFWPATLPGGFIGVDVFFVLSGFLITSSLLREIELQRFSIPSIWAKRIKRIFPASFVVLLATAVAIIIYVPISKWSQWLTELQASLVFGQNWKLAADSVDYLALSNSASPVQHFWYLGVDMQMFLLLPLVVGLGLLIVKGKSTEVKRRMTFVLLALLTVGSFAYSIYLTVADAAAAYFSTGVRAWEYGLGALVAFLPRISNKVRATLLSLLGVLVVVTSGLVFDNTVPFPGAIALIPGLGAAFVLLASANQGIMGSIFSFAPIKWIGDKSFSIYLWHFPLLVLAPFILGQNLNDALKIVLLIVTVLLAWLTNLLVEKRFMALGLVTKARPLAVFVTFALVSGLSIGSLAYAINDAEQRVSAEISESEKQIEKTPNCIGASAQVLNLKECEDLKIDRLFPTLDAAASDSGISVKVCGSMKREDEIPKVCKLGVENSSTKIAVIGDSHAVQYAGAFADLAKKNNWEVDLFWKGACPFSETQRVHEPVLQKACTNWIQNSKKLILESNYNLVVTSAASGVAWRANEGETVIESAENGFTKMWQSLNNAGIAVLAIKDNPRPIPKVIDCLTLNDEASCRIEKDKAFGFDPIIGAAKKMSGNGVTYADFDNIFCSETECLPVIGHVIVYRDANHVTNTFGKTMAPFIEPYVLKALEF